jgi:hypothetical protein
VKAGDSFSFRTTAPVVAGDVTIASGTPGSGEIVRAHPGGQGVKPSSSTSNRVR